jgi:hypothetical protein
MDCFNQFQFNIQNNTTYLSGVTSNRWTDGDNKGWVILDNSTLSTFNIEGFKNINLYGVKMLGNVQSVVAIGNRGIVTDYNMDVEITGTVPKISGTFTTNGYNINTSTPNIQLGKFQNTIMFSDPIQSVSQIKINNFKAQGLVPESGIGINLNMFLTFYFYYRYEGED